jgi:anti-anti-sigma factor
MIEPTSSAPLFQVLPLGHGVGLRLAGELDISTVGDLRAALETLPDGAATLDLGGLSFIDASGLHALEQYARSLNGSAPLRLDNVSAHVRRLFELTGMSTNPLIQVRGEADG